ncbi:MAG TPA: glycosyltransferase family 2 protein [Bacteroidales bacterium]|nr:glycosyltransferase family 2 protein [Bacteroidales bacterium]
MKLSVVIPAFNEAASLAESLPVIHAELNSEGIDHEILVINDNSTDNTDQVLEEIGQSIPVLRYLTNTGPNGFGFAVRKGLENFTGDCVAIMMADLSDSPKDLVRFYRTMADGNFDCVFGSRFIRGGETIGYPAVKKIINRIANYIIRITFRIRYNDTTNAFKLYRRETIEGLKPFLAPHFNLTIELPLKAIIRGYSYEVVPNSWRNRKYGESKLRIREMGSRYLFILLYCLIEKYFTRGDFRKKW